MEYAYYELAARNRISLLAGGRLNFLPLTYELAVVSRAGRDRSCRWRGVHSDDMECVEIGEHRVEVRDPRPWPLQSDHLGRSPVRHDCSQPIQDRAAQGRSLRR